MKIAVKNIAGKEVTTLELNEQLFGVPQNDTLVHQVYVAQKSNARSVIAHTKDRAERAGSGKKPWRQKGTGRARAGMVRSPLWRKGGITFGPTKERNFSQATNRKMRQKAVLTALSDKVRAGKMVVLDALALSPEKTTVAATMLKTLGLTPKSVLISTTEAERMILRLVRNIPRVETARSADMSVVEILDAEFLLLSKDSIAELEKRFALWTKNA